jgi:hypothetical protein
VYKTPTSHIVESLPDSPYYAFLLAVTSRCLMLSYWQSQVVVSCFPIGGHKSLSHAFLLAVTSRCLMLSYWWSQVVVSCLPIGSHKSLSHAFLLAVTSRCLISPYFYIVLRYYRTCSRPEYARIICHCAFCNR